MIKKLIYAMSAIALSFLAEGMIQNGADQGLAVKIESVVSERCEKVLGAQLYQLGRKFGLSDVVSVKPSINPEVRRRVIDISYENFIVSYIGNLFSKCSEEERESDGYRKISALMNENRDLQGNLLSNESFSGLCCDELFDLSRLSKTANDKFALVVSKLSLHQFGM